MQGMIIERGLTGNPCVLQVFFEFVDGVGAVVEDGGGQRGVGFAFGQDTVEVVGLPCPAGGDHRDVGGARDGAREIAIEAVSGRRRYPWR